MNMEDLRKFKTLTQEQYKEFYEKGFIVLKNVFDMNTVKRVEDSFQLLWEEACRLDGETKDINGSRFVFEEHGGLNRIVWCGGIEQYLLQLSKSEKILEPVADLLGSETVNQIINQAHFKMPGDKVEFKWHQDSEHRRYGTDQWQDINGLGSYVQTVLAIDEMTEENGPLLFIPESNRDGHIDLKNQPHKIEQYQHLEKVRLTMAPGDLALFGPYTIHSSSVNKSNGPRRVLINGYAYPGANGRVYPGVGLGRELAIGE